MALSWGASLLNFLKKTKKNKIDVEKENQKIVDDTGEVVRKNAARFSPVRTGLLRSKWLLVLSGKGSKRKAQVINNVPYAVYQEHGTIKIPPKRMLQRALVVGERYRQRRLKQLEQKLARDF
jgi:hypothetical protein